MKTRYITVILILFAFVVNSCDKIDPPYVESRDYCSGNKKVLLEDYTGHGCVNCPGAAVLAHELKEKFCDRVVIIGVHAGFFAQPDFEGNPVFSADLTTEAGNAWDSFFGNSALGNPNGLVDRVQGANGYVLFPSVWGETIDPLLEQPALALITINNDFNTDSKILTTTIKTNFQTDLVGDYKLIVCITQDNIISPQKNNNEEIGPTPIDSTYVHNHVLRKAINGSWGENLTTSGTVTTNTTYEKTYTQEFISKWVPKDCHIVAFVYNEETKEVLQVEELAVLD
ncbi:MAG: Omp28 family outer membrane lipoprotein [Bacteroidota bacterium]